MTVQPAYKGLIEIKDIDIKEIVPFIHWSFFFMAWRLSGKFDGIETVCECGSCKVDWLSKFDEADRPKAEEALKLFKDAQEMLRTFRDEKILTLNASVGLYPAYSRDEDIFINNGEIEVKIPTLRQQMPSTDGFCYSLADFIKPEDDYIGVFANTVAGVEEYAKEFEAHDDVYNSILAKTLADRLAEATAEWLHFQVRTKYWAYAADEKLSINDMFKVKYSGIRPAVGYPSLPDQSIMFELDPLLHFKDLGILVTENGALYPTASVCGLYFAHPKSKYFMIGKIDQQQLEDYAQRKGKTPAEIKKWMAANL